jgi:hypothetical protein
MNKESISELGRNPTTQNDASQMQSSQNSPSVSDNPNSDEQRNSHNADNPNDVQGISRNMDHQNNLQGILQNSPEHHEQERDQSNALIHNSAVFQNILPSVNRAAFGFDLRRRSLDSLLSEALNVSAEALAEMRHGSNQLATPSSIEIRCQSSDSSNNDRGQSEEALAMRHGSNQLATTLTIHVRRQSSDSSSNDSAASSLNGS